jgi:hypothetical protein
VKKADLSLSETVSLQATLSGMMAFSGSTHPMWGMAVDSFGIRTANSQHRTHEEQYVECFFGTL